MFYCEPCREKNNWPGIIKVSYGKCEECGGIRGCYDVPTAALPKPVEPPKPVMKRFNGTEWVVEPSPKRAERFLALFTDEERASWAGKDNRPPVWVTLGIVYFLNEEPENKELMRRLKESGD
jgi:hypothetical protein